jgi:hypothetical protein
MLRRKGDRGETIAAPKLKSRTGPTCTQANSAICVATDGVRPTNDLEQEDRAGVRGQSPLVAKPLN